LTKCPPLNMELGPSLTRHSFRTLISFSKKQTSVGRCDNVKGDLNVLFTSRESVK
jgi:hypothetical protein